MRSAGAVDAATGRMDATASRAGSGAAWRRQAHSAARTPTRAVRTVRGIDETKSKRTRRVSGRQANTHSSGSIPDLGAACGRERPDDG